EELTSEATGKWDEKKRTLTWTSNFDGRLATTIWKFVDEDTFTWDLLAKDNTGKVLLDMSGRSKSKKRLRARSPLLGLHLTRRTGDEALVRHSSRRGGPVLLVLLLMLVVAFGHFNRISISVAGTERLIAPNGISETRMGWVYSGFLWCYTLAMLPGGLL